MLLSAIAYNLKKLLKQQPKQVPSVAVARYSEQPGRVHRLFSMGYLISNIFESAF